jgi:choline dehydrogenase
VLLLEAGGRDNYPWIHIPVGYLYCIGNPRTDWCFKTETQAGLQGRSLSYPRGKVLGGCSSINGMIYMRGQASDYDRWAERGQPGLGLERRAAAVQTQRKTLCRQCRCMHSSDGEWRVEQQRYAWPILDAFREAAAQSGIPPSTISTPATIRVVATFRSTSVPGCAGMPPRHFLRPILKRPNLTVLTDVHVDKVLLDDGRATHVRARWQGTEQDLQRAA